MSSSHDHVKLVTPKSVAPTPVDIIRIGGVYTEVLQYPSGEVLPTHDAQRFDHFHQQQNESSFQRLLVVIPGNPGMAEFYDLFCAELHSISQDQQNQVGILSVGHAGHSRSDMNNGIRFDLSQQIRHKAVLIRKLRKLHPNAKITLIGHSVGSHMILRLLAGDGGDLDSHDWLEDADELQFILNGFRSSSASSSPLSASPISASASPSRHTRDAYKPPFSNSCVDKAALLFPTIQHIASRKGPVHFAIKRGFRHVLSAAAGLLGTALPHSLQIMLVKLLGPQDKEAHRIVPKMLSYTCVHNILYMAETEFRDIKALDEPMVRHFLPRLLFYFGEKDEWVPRWMVDDVLARFGSKQSDVGDSKDGASTAAPAPAANIVLDEDKTPHAFVLGSSEKIARRIAHFSGLTISNESK